jgi:hypothetical protein
LRKIESRERQKRPSAAGFLLIHGDDSYQAPGRIALCAVTYDQTGSESADGSHASIAAATASERSVMPTTTIVHEPRLHYAREAEQRRKCSFGLPLNGGSPLVIARQRMMALRDDSEMI